MKQRPRAHLCVEELENRLVPALNISYFPSPGVNLNITGNPTAPVTITQQAGGAFRVMEGAINYGNYLIGGSLNVTTNNRNDMIILTINGGGLIPSGVNVSTNNSTDVVTIQTAGAGIARIGGNLMINTGFGSDNVNLSPIVGTTLQVSGSTQFIGSTGADAFSLNPRCVLGSSLTGTQVNVFTVDDSTINGNVTIDNSGDLTMIANTSFTSTAIVAGNTTYIGGSGPDSIQLSGTFGTVPMTNVNVNLGEGNNAVVFDGDISNGSFTYTGGALSDFVLFSAPGFIIGNATFNMGEGNNLYFFAPGGWTVGGNFTVNAGSGNDDLGSVAGDVFGNVSLDLGSGADNVSFDGSVGGATITATMGDGDDTITYNMTTSAPSLDVRMGAGNDTFNFGGPAVTFGSATLRFGLDFPAFPFDVLNMNGLIAAILFDGEPPDIINP